MTTPTPAAPWPAWSLPPALSGDDGAWSAPELADATAPGGAALRWIRPTSEASSQLIDELRRAGHALRRQPVSAIAAALGRAGARFGTPDDPLRVEALRDLPAHAGVSDAQARWIVNGMARDWTAPRLRRLLAGEFVDPGVLDGFRTVGSASASRTAPGDGVGERAADRASAGGHQRDRRLRGLGPELALHIVAGTVPGVGVTSLIRGLLVKGPVLLKPGAGDALLPVLFARALGEAAAADGPDSPAAALAHATAVLYWPGGSSHIEEPFLAAADQVVVHGADETVLDVRRRLAAHTRLVSYHHRVSIAVFGEGIASGLGRSGPAPTREAATAAVLGLARAVVSFDQRGCVCPHQVFVLGGDHEAATWLAAELADALAREASRLPAGPPDPHEAARVQQVRGAAEMRAAAGERVRLFGGANLAWTVVLDPEPRARPACFGRTVHVTPVVSRDALSALLAPLRHHLQSVGAAGLSDDDLEVLAAAGATRIVPMADLPFPPAWWLHDGRGPLTELVRWVEAEPV